MKRIVLTFVVLLLVGCNQVMDMYLSLQHKFDLYQMDFGDIYTEKDISNWIINNTDYEIDYLNINQDPETTIKRGKGDCEDFAILFMNIAYFELGEKYSLVYLNDGRAVVNGGTVNHAIVSKNGRHFDPISGEVYSNVGYIYKFGEVFN